MSYWCFNKLDKTSWKKNKSTPRWGKKNQRLTCSYTFRSPIREKAVNYSIYRRPGTDPNRACNCCFSLCEFAWALLNWFRAPDPLCPFCLPDSFSTLFCRAHWAQRANNWWRYHLELCFQGLFPLHNVWLWVSVSIWCRRKFLWWLNKSWYMRIAEYH